MSGQSQRSGFDSRSSLNFFRIFFNRLGSFYCEDRVHLHIKIGMLTGRYVIGAN